MKFKVRVVFGVLVLFMIYISFRFLVQDFPDEARYDIYDVNPPEVPQNHKIILNKITQLDKKHAEQNIKKKPTVDNDTKKLDAAFNEVVATNKSALLPPLPNMESRESIIKWFIDRYTLDWDYHLTASPWEIPPTWITSRQIHPEHTPQLGAILREMTSRKVVSADVGHRGTQLKLLLTLEGGQKVSFKPKWYEREYIVKGKPYDGKDRHNAEIVAFHLSRLLSLRKVPLAVGRTVDLENEIKPVATPKLLKTFFTKDENTCFLGKCMYCKTEEDGACADGTIMEGTLILWLPRPWTNFRQRRHPWARTYVPGKLARWEVRPKGYCEYVQHFSPYNEGPLLLDILDASVFDYLIGNADRHHYETFREHDDSMLVMLDNAKSFGNHEHDEKSILAPVSHCCLLRQTTWERLQLLKDGVLSRVLRRIVAIDPISPLLTDAHYQAIDRRLLDIYDLVEECIEKHGIKEVLMADKRHSPKS